MGELINAGFALVAFDAEPLKPESAGFIHDRAQGARVAGFVKWCVFRNRWSG